MSVDPRLRADYSGLTSRRWLWPLLDLGLVALDTAARVARWHRTNRDARTGDHAGHTLCRHGRAVVLDGRAVPRP